MPFQAEVEMMGPRMMFLNDKSLHELREGSHFHADKLSRGSGISAHVVTGTCRLQFGCQDKKGIDLRVTGQ